VTGPPTQADEKVSKTRTIFKGENMQILTKIFVFVLIGHLSQVLLLAQSPTAVVKAVDAKAVYRLSNDYSGPDKFLTISEDGLDLNMVDATRSPKQLWKFIPLSGDSFRMVSLYDEEKSLDVNKSSGGYSVVMGERGDFTGQTWSFITLKEGKFRFLNAFAGDERSLDVHRNGDVFSVVVGDSGDYSGQAWTLTKATQ
jgi:hypothetical protein